jgi:hypothetical protein
MKKKIVINKVFFYVETQSERIDFRLSHIKPTFNLGISRQTNSKIYLINFSE